MSHTCKVALLASGLLRWLPASIAIVYALTGRLVTSVVYIVSQIYDWTALCGSCTKIM